VTQAPPQEPAPLDPLEELPSHRDDFARLATSGLVGGIWGRYAGVKASGWWTPVRVLLAMTCFTLLLAFAQKAPCASGDWSGSKQYTHACYSDIVPLWSDERLDVGAVPYRDTAVEYPVLTGGFMWLTADITRAVSNLSSRFTELTNFSIVSALLLGLCALVVTLATANCAVGADGRRRPYDAAIFALSPLLVFHAFTNWDLLAMALTSCAIWAWMRDKPVLTGFFIGLGTAAKLYPVFLLVGILVIAWRRRRWAEFGWVTLAAVVSWCTVNVPIALAYHKGWWEFYEFSKTRAVERSTLWAIVHTGLSSTGLDTPDAGYWVPPGTAVALLLLAALLFVVWCGLRATRTPSLAQLTFLAVLAFLLTTKVWSPQYSLWLVPLIALARPKWRLQLIWQFTEIAVWVVTLQLLLHLDPNNTAHGVDYGWLVLVLLARDGLLIALAVLIIRDMWHKDPVAEALNPVVEPDGFRVDTTEASDVVSTGATSQFGRETAPPVLWTGSPTGG
jgi:uncharacterized membrane protein